MINTKSLLAAAVFAAYASVAVAGDVVVGQNGGTQAPQATTGSAANPYQLGTLDAEWTVMQVTLTSPASFTEYATFTVPVTHTLAEGVGTSYSLILNFPGFPPITIWDITGFQTTVKAGSPTSPGAPESGPLTSGAGFSGLALTPGSYFLQFDGTSVGSGAQYSASLRALPAVPEPETYALMLAGLGAVTFVARRRRREA